MSPETTRQVWQSAGQFLIIFFSGMAVFKGWSEVVQMGVANAVYQPFVQAVIGTLSIFGFSKLGPKP